MEHSLFVFFAYFFHCSGILELKQHKQTYYNDTSFHMKQPSQGIIPILFEHFLQTQRYIPNEITKWGNMYLKNCIGQIMYVLMTFKGHVTKEPISLHYLSLQYFSKASTYINLKVIRCLR